MKQENVSITYWIVFIGIWLTLGLILPATLVYIKNLSKSSTSNRTKWIRRLYWKSIWIEVINKVHNHKVESYMIGYLRKSEAAKKFYINNGYPSFRREMINRIEQYERFVEEYKYNTFDHLKEFERRFIDDFQKRRKGK